MEPSHSLNIAVAVAEFLDFTSALLDEPKNEVYQANNHPKVEASGQSTHNILRLGDSLKHLASCMSETGGDWVADHEQALENILLECHSISQQLFDIHQRLEVKRPDRSKTGALTKSHKKIWQKGFEWARFRKAVKTVWTCEYIQSLKARLSTSRQELAISVLACLNSQLDVRPDTLPGLESSEAKIVDVLSFHRGEMGPTLPETEPHGEVLAAIVTLGNGKVQSILPKSAICLKGCTTASKEIAMRIYQPKDGGTFLVSLIPFNSELFHRQVLFRLHFRQTKDRINQVQDAHKATFNWIFHPPDDSPKPWSDFPRWLESGHGCFWINGKAGSGKSTLMKYILDDQRTLSHLNNWAGEAHLVTASFFFWSLGSPVQKTQEGLLRSLLHDVLERCPDLIPVVMPELCKEVIDSQTQSDNHLENLSLPQLTRWFSRLVQQASPSCRMFFQIDGIDEYEGGYLEIVNLITESASENVKFLISSRTIAACTERFASGPGLRLHDLTRDDMVRYCDSVIGKRLVKRGYIPEKSQLIEEIVVKSSGVFLWLVLVVRSVLQGIQDGEDTTQLRTRLGELPTDLPELYAHLIREIPAEFRSQVSEILQIYAKSCQIEQDIRGHPILAVQLSFAGESWDTVLNTPLTKLSRKKERARVEEVNRRLREQCCGFLEVQKRARRPRIKSLAEHLLASSTSKVVRLHIGFIHQTVAEFIRDEKVYAEIKSWNGEFDPYQGLFKSCVMMVKSFPMSEVVHPRGSLVWESMNAGLRYAQLAERGGRPVPVKYLDAFDEVLSFHWDRAQVYHQGGRYENVSRRHWSTMLFHVSDERGEGGGLDGIGAVNVGGEGNRFRYLSSSSKKCHELISQTERLGFFRVAVAYGLGSYIRAKMTEAVAAELVRFWRDLLMSSFPVRVKMRADTALSSSLLGGAIHAMGDTMDCEDAFAVWNVFLVELCSGRDLSRMTAQQAEAMGTLASEFLHIHLANRPWTDVSGRYGHLLLQLGGFLKSKASRVGLYEILDKSVAVAAAHGGKGKRSKMSVVVVSRELTASTSEGSSSDNGSTRATATPVSSRENLQLALTRLHEILWEGFAGGNRWTRILKVGKGKLKLPMAKRRALWREWELQGRPVGMG